jgi:hypothetical protein
METARACAQHGLRSAMGSRWCEIYDLIPTSCGQGVIKDVEIRAVYGLGDAILNSPLTSGLRSFSWQSKGSSLSTPFIQVRVTRQGRAKATGSSMII